MEQQRGRGGAVWSETACQRLPAGQARGRSSIRCPAEGECQLRLGAALHAPSRAQWLFQNNNTRDAQVELVANQKVYPMDHTHIVQAGDLDRYAPTRDSQAVIPELVYWLVKQSCPDLVVCRIPYGDAVNQPGRDGLVETADGFREFVPKGKSYWEIGTGADPQTKATDDFKKRTEEIDDRERADSSFVFVTPRSSGSGGWNEPEQTKWLERRKGTGWGLIRVIDGVKLADWLREYPAIGKWMATKIPLTAKLGGLSTATEHWEDLISERAADDPPFPPKLFTAGRAGACEALHALFEGKTQVLMLFAESPQDVADFVSACRSVELSRHGRYAFWIHYPALQRSRGSWIHSRARRAQACQRQSD